MERVEQRFEKPLIVAAVLTIPTTILQNTSVGEPWAALGKGLNWLIWLAFLLANAVCHGAMIGTQPSLMGELFSTEVRYSGMALGHEIASVFAGGLSPLVATALLAKYHASWPVSLMLMAMGAITVVALLCARETAQRVAR